ncbi:M17 family metallopeptidase [Spiroplasma tabanidicola]|uniref:Probable cytosol aminopeptidase n=1 Tax=Spiroplasma tabanidicola TaxID=324079 RepID=A0A6I6CBQ0_9MOLU|nr:M17 family metallopeptidase [Spiroplasma tabanidicola]QGS52395.1 leucyl aminopeptidase family protein [Spiroplasma tabanidicola]
MITCNQKSFNITLKAITKESDVNPLVIKENKEFTLISEEKTLYVCMCPKMTLFKMQAFILDFVKSNNMDLNVDLDSFVEIYQNKEEVLQLLVETFMFANHKQIEMKTEETKHKSYDLIFSAQYENIYENSKIKLEYQNFARDLQDLPPNLGTSITIADKIIEKAKENKEIKVTVYGKKEAVSYGMNLFLAVNAGSNIDPRIVVLEYCGDSSKPKTALVGKGITFDSGGYNLKPGNYLKNMKYDMSGAAVVSATVMALAKRKAKCNVVSVAMLTDNKIGGLATLPESIVKSMNGLNVEIADTDAEGRLVLADGMTYAIREAKAERLFTVATLTGSIFSALGKWQTGVFANNDEFFEEFNQGVLKAQERIWRMPLLSEHLEPLEFTKIADIASCELSNKDGAYSCTAAAFLNQFSEEKPYLHLDIAGTADFDARGLAPMQKSLYELLNK